jgi:hypothetical protein
MKMLFITSLFLLFFSCNDTNSHNSSEKNDTQKIRSDTIVKVLVIPDEIAGTGYIEKEYFVVIKSDTSTCSSIITKNKSTGKVSMKYKHDPYGKIPYSFSLDDTVAVAEGVPIKKMIKKLSYKDQIRELQLILNYASKDFKFNRLSNVSFMMSSIDGLPESITKQYLNKYGEKFADAGNEKAANLIKGANLTEDLNKILARYSLSIKNIYIDGLAYYARQDLPKGTKPLLDGSVIISLFAIP